MPRQVPAGTEFTPEQYKALKDQVASGVQQVRYENKGAVTYIEPQAAIQLLDRMERELQQREDGEGRIMSRRTYYRRS